VLKMKRLNCLKKKLGFKSIKSKRKKEKGYLIYLSHQLILNLYQRLRLMIGTQAQSILYGPPAFTTPKKGVPVCPFLAGRMITERARLGFLTLKRNSAAQLILVTILKNPSSLRRRLLFASFVFPTTEGSYLVFTSPPILNGKIRLMLWKYWMILNQCLRQ